MPVRAIGVNHIAFEVHDLDQTLEWYGRYFEFELRGRRGGMAWIDLGDQFIALSEGGPETPDRSRHVGLVVDDKEALRAILLEDGREVAPSGSLRVRDPSGNLLEIVDYRDVQFSKTPAVLRSMGLDGLVKNKRRARRAARQGHRPRLSRLRDQDPAALQPAAVEVGHRVVDRVERVGATCGGVTLPCAVSVISSTRSV